jgi:hypothetical protein
LLLRIVWPVMVSYVPANRSSSVGDGGAELNAGADVTIA